MSFCSCFTKVRQFKFFYFPLASVLARSYIATCSVVDRHRFDADLDPTFNVDAVPGPDSDHTLNFTHVGKSNISFDSSVASLHCFIFFVSAMCVIIFHYF
jgi:hypothetical protein